MSDDYRAEARKLRRALIVAVVWGLGVFPAANVAQWRFGLASHAQGRYLLQLLALYVVLLAAFLAIAFVEERRTLSASRARGGPYPVDRMIALVRSTAAGLMVAFPGFLAAGSAGWIWGAAFYAVFALFLLRVLLLWRQCEREAVG